MGTIFQALASYQPDTNLIGIEYTEDSSRVIVIEKSAYTCWSRLTNCINWVIRSCGFKSFSYQEFRRETIIPYLAEYPWSNYYSEFWDNC